MLKLKNLIVSVFLTLMPFQLTAGAAPANPAIIPIISYLLSDSTFSFGDFAGKTKYFVNEDFSIGYRFYIDTDNYNGVVGGVPVIGTYVYDENSMTLSRDGGTVLVFTNPRPTTFGNGMTFDLSVNGGATFQTHNYDTPEERDAAFIYFMSYSYEELASNTYYGVNEDGSDKLVVTYAELGTNERNITVGSFEHSLTPTLQTFSINENIITINDVATIVRIAKFEDYSLILYDHDGDGPIEAVLKRIYSEKDKAEAFYLTKTMAYTYEELAGNEYYGVNEDGSTKLVITYAELNTNERNVTIGSFDQTDQFQQIFSITDNVITLDPATITRIAIPEDGNYSQILYDEDGDGSAVAILRRIYTEEEKAQAYYDSLQPL